MTSGLWKNFLKQILDDMSVERRDLPAIIMFDNAKCHNVSEIKDAWAKENVHLVYLPPNTTHLLQPLDALPFATYKRKLRDFEYLCDDDVPVNSESLNLKEKNVTEALERALQKHIIRRGFRQTHVYPFDKEKIVEVVEKNVANPVTLDILLDDPDFLEAYQEFSSSTDSATSNGGVGINNGDAHGQSEGPNLRSSDPDPISR